MTFSITKQANGRYRWHGYPTNNALDRDGDTVSAGALREFAKELRDTGNYPPLQFFHKYTVGTTDYVTVVDNFLVATGEFSDDPVSKAVAEGLLRMPAGVDDSGWGMSWRFYSVPDHERVFHKIRRAVEFTVLPLSRAANPYTKFDVKGKGMNEEERKALDLVLSNPALLAMADTALKAQESSKALDESGIQRKAAAEEAKCKSCGHADHDAKTCATEGCACKGAATKSVTEADEASAEDVSDLAKATQMFVDERLDDHVKEFNKAMAAIVEVVKDLQGQLDAIKADDRQIKELVKPRHIGIYEQMKAASAALSADTEIDKDNPLAKQAAAAGGADFWSRTAGL